MKLLRGFGRKIELAEGCYATIGNFDGMHLGHQQLLRELQQRSVVDGKPQLVILFEPQPSEYFRGVHAPTRLMSLREKIDYLNRFGVDYVYCISFNAQMAQLTPQQFVTQYFFECLNVQLLLVGQDFRFGCDRTGDVAYLQQVGLSHGMQVLVSQEVMQEQCRVSSTGIRAYLHQAQLEQAAQWLGRLYTLTGRVIHGDGLARQWGIPTANLKLSRDLPALRGVFCVQVQLPHGEKVYGVANIGQRPTIDGLQWRVEVHLLNYNGKLYGQHITLCFLHRLRDEMKFSSVDALVAQIHQDVDDAKTYCQLRESIE